ncbi:MAG: hypothetical protein ACREJG_13640 [Candidatus Rokuibacteriota bacterium]
MQTATIAAAAVGPAAPLFRLGHMFINPLFDYLVIGGGLSLLAGILLWSQGVVLGLGAGALLYVFLISNNAHFAASTVRLYTRPGATRALPLVTLALPVAALVAATTAIVVPEPAGMLLFATYLIWSPYHYSAQAYGLAVMYAYRSGADLHAPDKQLIRAACLAPFLWTVLQPQGGMAMVVARLGLTPVPALEPLRAVVSAVLSTLTLLAPLLVFIALRRRAGVTLPAISVLVIASNAVWWTLFNYLDAFVWAAVFHGLQYLAIVTIFHVKDRLRRPGHTRSWRFHTVAFYGTCVALGYLLFEAWPAVYGLAGLDVTRSVLLVTATINIHHFIVDAFIWRLRKDPNYRNVVDDTLPLPDRRPGGGEALATGRAEQAIVQRDELEG